MKITLVIQKSTFCMISGECTLGNCRGDPGAGKKFGGAGDQVETLCGENLKRLGSSWPLDPCACQPRIRSGEVL